MTRDTRRLLVEKLRQKLSALTAPHRKPHEDNWDPECIPCVASIELGDGAKPLLQECIAALSPEAVPSEAEQAHEYLSRLLVSAAPACEPLPDLLGLCSQIDNLLTGLPAEVVPSAPAGLRARAEALLAKVTPGEWCTDPRGVVAQDYRFNTHGVRRIATCSKTTAYPQPELDAENNANAKFIAAAPQLVRDLLAALDGQGDAKVTPAFSMACECAEPDPVMQADRKFYCHACSFETGARPRYLEPEMLDGQWDAAVLPARELHIAFNVANRRAGGTGPACDGPDCQVCDDLLKAAGDAAPRVAASQQEKEQEKDDAGLPR